MLIDASGRITRPYQTYFYVYSSQSTQSSSAKVAFDTAAQNVGNAFNTSTNTFTAPTFDPEGNLID